METNTPNAFVLILFSLGWFLVFCFSSENRKQYIYKKSNRTKEREPPTRARARKKTRSRTWGIFSRPHCQFNEVGKNCSVFGLFLLWHVTHGSGFFSLPIWRYFFWLLALFIGFLQPKQTAPHHLCLPKIDCGGLYQLFWLCGARAGPSEARGLP